MNRFYAALILSCMAISLFAQVAPQKFVVEFMDKTGTPFSISRPNEFLSERAIVRRQVQGIPIDEKDLPVNPSYVNRIMAMNVRILSRSKWLNCITISCLNLSILDSISQLPFVKNIVKNIYIESVNDLYSYNNDISFKFINQYTIVNNGLTESLPKMSNRYNYGYSYNQVHMLQGDSLHNQRFTGAGKIIAVLDGGFYNVDKLWAFETLWINNQIITSRDFVEPGNDVFREAPHGMEVLSCMGGYMDGLLVGTAPDASYLLLRTEDVNSEYLIEEYNWVAGAEFADSAGADIINSSLGYSVFDDPVTSHSCSDMTGNHTVVTRGANIAAATGMMVVNSAGNAGGSAWKCISAPADGFGVMAVAAVDSNGIRAGFSSTGTTTGRIKPNVAAKGAGTIVSSTIGTIMAGNGTSFSAPLISGMMACLWQALPGYKPADLQKAVEWSASQAMNPDSLLGYGIPGFATALAMAGIPKSGSGEGVSISPVPFNDQFTISFPSAVGIDRIEVLDIYGRSVREITDESITNRESRMIDRMSHLPAGIYVVVITTGTKTIVKKTIKGQ